MNIVGIIAEYNPFHNGHRYQLQEAIQRTGAQGVICAMSGNFMQRGEPAMVDKWSRAEMALAQGADLVFELPALFATRSAHWFARGGVGLLAQTGIVTHLAFGAETAHLPDLQKAAHWLAEEPLLYQKHLKAALKQGLSFPRARSNALKHKFPGLTALWSAPNNVLALAYLQVISEKNLTLLPLAIKRQGLGYHDSQLQEGHFASATAIRQAILKARSPKEALIALQEYLPPSTSHILEGEFTKGQGPIFFSALEDMLMLLLRRTPLSQLRDIIEIEEGLEHRMQKTALECTTLYDFLEKLKTKRYTYSRLQRALIHLLLDYTRDKTGYLTGGLPYLRVLGYTSKGHGLLKAIKRNSSLPIITKGAHAHKYLENPHFRVFWECDVLATNLYSLLYPGENAKIGALDYLRGPVFSTRFSNDLPNLL